MNSPMFKCPTCGFVSPDRHTHSCMQILREELLTHKAVVMEVIDFLHDDVLSAEKRVYKAIEMLKELRNAPSENEQ